MVYPLGAVRTTVVGLNICAHRYKNSMKKNVLVTKCWSRPKYHSLHGDLFDKNFPKMTLMSWLEFLLMVFGLDTTTN